MCLNQNAQYVPKCPQFASKSLNMPHQRGLQYEEVLTWHGSDVFNHGILELLLSVKWKAVNLLEASLKPKRVEEFILKRHIFGIQVFL